VYIANIMHHIESHNYSHRCIRCWKTDMVLCVRAGRHYRCWTTLYQTASRK